MPFGHDVVTFSDGMKENSLSQDDLSLSCPSKHPFFKNLQRPKDQRPLISRWGGAPERYGSGGRISLSPSLFSLLPTLTFKSTLSDFKLAVSCLSWIGGILYEIPGLMVRNTFVE